MALLITFIFRKYVKKNYLYIYYYYFFLLPKVPSSISNQKWVLIGPTICSHMAVQHKLAMQRKLVPQQAHQFHADLKPM